MVINFTQAQEAQRKLKWKGTLMDCDYILEISAGADGGPCSAQARPSAQPPINTSGNISVHMSAKSPSIISPNH
jgi:hypothetical protein